MTYLSRLWRVAVWALLVALVATLLATVLVPRVAGATPYTVLTGSMKPDMPPGTLAVTRPVAIEDVSVGDVVTYQIDSGKPEVVTHRVVAVGSSMTGERTLRTQGDANPSMDPEPVREVQLRGELWYSVPYVGRLGNYASGDQRALLTNVAAGVLIAYAVVMVGGSVLRRNRRPRGRRISTSGTAS